MQILVDVVTALKVHHAMVSTSILTAGEEHASSHTCTGTHETRSGRKGRQQADPHKMNPSFPVSHSPSPPSSPPSSLIVFNKVSRLAIL